jgi:hypothetical protein
MSFFIACIYAINSASIGGRDVYVFTLQRYNIYTFISFMI